MAPNFDREDELLDRCIHAWKRQCNREGVIHQQPDRGASQVILTPDGQLQIELHNVNGRLATFQVIGERLTLLDPDLTPQEG
jgi:hypothetical protein